MNDLEKTIILRTGIRDVCTSFGNTAMTSETRMTFLPSSHVNAAAFDVTLVEGYCGFGKTHLWHYLGSVAHQQNVARWAQESERRHLVTAYGFGENLNRDEVPDRATLALLWQHYHGKDKTFTSAVWRAVLAHGLGFDGEFALLANWEQRVAWVHANPNKFKAALESADARLAVADQMHMVLFDSLEQLADNWADTLHWLKGLMQVAREVRNTRHIRCKIFLRPDMMTGIVQQSQDADQLLPYKKELWRRCDFYSLFFRHLANHPEAGALFRDICHQLGQTWLQNKRDGQFFPPKPLNIDEDVQAKVFHELTGRRMGEVSPHAPPYVWLINCLQDSLGFVSPKSFMATLAGAAEMVEQTCSQVLDGRAIFKGRYAKSDVRPKEIFSNHPWVELVFRPLVGQLQLPIPLHQIEEKWRTHKTLETLVDDLLTGDFAVKLPPKSLARGAHGVIDDLWELGVLQVLLNGEIQMNDVYRTFFGFGRKGGIYVIN